MGVFQPAGRSDGAGRVQALTEEHDIANPNVLIVDDTKEIQRLLKMVLGFEDIDVAGIAESADEGVAMARELKPDAVVLDVMMPGKSGLDVIEEILAAAADTKILVYSSVGVAEETREEALARGAHAYLNKVEVESVPSKLKELLAG